MKYLFEYDEYYDNIKVYLKSDLVEEGKIYLGSARKLKRKQENQWRICNYEGSYTFCPMRKFPSLYETAVELEEIHSEFIPILRKERGEDIEISTYFQDKLKEFNEKGTIVARNLHIGITAIREYPTAPAYYQAIMGLMNKDYPKPTEEERPENDHVTVITTDSLEETMQRIVKASSEFQFEDVKVQLNELNV